MLLPNQRKTIEEAVARGEALNAEMSSALLAAYTQADRAHSNVFLQLQQSNSEKSALQWQKDETVRLQKHLEKEIDERVEMRTQDLKGYLEIAKAAKERAESSATYYERISREQVEEIDRIARKYGYMIRSMKELIEKKINPRSLRGFLTRFTWTRSAKRVLAEVDGLQNPHLTGEV